MPLFSNTTKLSKYRMELKENRHLQAETEPIITIGMGTCGIAAGAAETLHAIERELQKHDIKAKIRSVGCIGMCVNEPLVDVQFPGEPRVTYINIRVPKVARLIEEHVARGEIIHEWAIGFLPPQW
ncbi:MAG: (2Fe-2S) ferredoxin domain-containing protein [Anaerolineales bacterium]|nr:(2Fe-2S) ferredoxin domain-containing protein [Anaerolineales bacterium]